MNTKIDDGSDVLDLMRIFTDRGYYNYERFPKTSERKSHFVNTEKGDYEMYELVENYAQQYSKQ